MYVNYIKLNIRVFVDGLYHRYISRGLFHDGRLTNSEFN